MQQQQQFLSLIASLRGIEDATVTSFLSPKAVALCESSDVSALAELAEEVNKLKFALSEANALVTALGKSIDYLASSVMPEIMRKNGLVSYVTCDGVTCKADTKVFASLPKEDIIKRKIAIDWLKEHGGAAIVKDTLTVESPTPEFAEMAKEQFGAVEKEDVHPSTLKSFISELLGYKKGAVAQFEPEELPAELGCFVKTTVVIK